MRESQTILAVLREGEIKTMCCVLRDLLDRRFGALDAKLIRRIEDTTDLDALTRAYARTFDIASPDEIGL